MQSQKLIVPLGIQITTNQNKYFWFSVGLEIAPAFNYAYTFYSMYSASETEMLVGVDDDASSPSAFSRPNSSYDEWGIYKTSLYGIGFGAYLSTPLCINVRPFRKVKLLNRFHAMLAIIPAYMYTKSKYSGSASDMAVSACAGLRYNLKN
jgi:hypothetical protein